MLQSQDAIKKSVSFSLESIEDAEKKKTKKKEEPKKSREGCSSSKKSKEKAIESSSSDDDDDGDYIEVNIQSLSKRKKKSKSPSTSSTSSSSTSSSSTTPFSSNESSSSPTDRPAKKFSEISANMRTLGRKEQLMAIKEAKKSYLISSPSPTSASSLPSFSSASHKLVGDDGYALQDPSKSFPPLATECKSPSPPSSPSPSHATSSIATSSSFSSDEKIVVASVSADGYALQDPTLNGQVLSGDVDKTEGSLSDPSLTSPPNSIESIKDVHVGVVTSDGYALQNPSHDRSEDEESRTSDGYALQERPQTSVSKDKLLKGIPSKPPRRLAASPASHSITGADGYALQNPASSPARKSKTCHSCSFSGLGGTKQLI